MARGRGSGGASAQPRDAPAGAAASAASSLLPEGVTIRDYRKEDEAAVVPMWKRGFHEMAPHSYARLFSGPAPFISFLSIAAGVGLGFGAWRTAAVIAAAGAALYTPAGEWALSGLFWQIVGLQARASMVGIESRWMVPGQAHFYVAEVAGRPVGCVAVKGVHTLNSERARGVAPLAGEASVWRLTVDPSARKLGLGRALMATAEEWARGQGFRHVSLITGNPESQAFYARLGYAPESEERARAVLFGGGQPAFPLGTAKARFLRTRLHVNKTVLAKQL
jgi:GNAT superfamily N-acetyltransferase